MPNLRTYVLAAGLTIALASAASAAEPPLPEFYGFYVVAEGRLYSLDPVDPALASQAQVLPVSRTERDFEVGGGVSLPVPLLPASLNFLVYVKGKALEAAGQLSLLQLPFIRTMTINANDRNWRRAYQLNSWVSTTEFGYTNVGATKIDLRFKPVKGQDEMVLAVPSTPLIPGLYRLGKEFIFAVSPIESAAAVRCIDATNGTAMGAWSIVPCSQAPVAPIAVAPAVREFDPGYSIAGRNVIFTYDPSAYGFTGTVSSVAVAGSFNSWSAESPKWRAAKESTSGRWILTAYRGDVTCGSQFKFVVNGRNWQSPSDKWPKDHLADDGHGGFNLIVHCK